MVGYKIKSLRQSMGLSQQQLAGKEMTRAFISLVESGKCTPSPKTLRIIAQRLGKPVDYFLEDKDTDDDLAVAIVLLDSARNDLETGGQEQAVLAQRKLNEVTKHTAGLDRTDLEAQARALLFRSLALQGKYEDAIEEGKLALDAYRVLGDTKGQAHVYRDLGVAAYKLQEYPNARRSFEKALLYASGLKSNQEFRMEILTNLGSTLFLLGELSESIERFREALAESEGLGDPVVTANAAMGLGWATFQSGDLKGAQRYTLLAINKFKEANHPDAVLAKHNLAIIEAARNNRETAYVILQSCLKTYREQGHIKKQASVLEEIARYWFQKGDLKRAEKVCWDALNLLDIHDNSLLRGRLYRFLGNIAASEENFAQAQAMLRVSHELFRCLKANAEAALSWESLEILKNNLAASQSASTQSSPE